ncbi:MAG: hypothetical protein PHH77_09205 [Victivallaceae bacterium]|nr:hypothetical protein [Victivallaceae bacterium]
MGHITISKRYREIIKNHRANTGTVNLAVEDLIRKGKEFSDMCDLISDYARKENKTPEGLVKEIFYSAVEYKNFLDRTLPLQVTEETSPWKTSELS